MKQLLNRLCDQDVPDAIISVHQRIELVFKSTFADQKHAGFFGAYEFIDESRYMEKKNRIKYYSLMLNNMSARACVCFVGVRTCACVCLACVCMCGVCLYFNP